MCSARDEWPFLEDAWVLALARTGNELTAVELLRSTFDATLAHPEASDPEALKVLLFQRLVRAELPAAVKSTASPGEIAVSALQDIPEPARSATVLQALGIFPAKDLARITGKTAPAACDAAVLGRLTAIEPGEATRTALVEMRTSANERRAKQRWNPRDPAFLSVVIGFLLLVGLLAWHFLGRAGVFPEDALTIATEVVKIPPESFDPIEVPAADAADWFLLKGFDKFLIPRQFAGAKAAGARLASVEKQPVAVLVIPENLTYFVVFDPHPLGISVTPAGSWRVTEFDYKYAAAIREEDGMCFMVVIRGTKAELKTILNRR